MGQRFNLNIMTNVLVGDRVILTPVNGGRGSAGIYVQFNPNIFANLVVWDRIRISIYSQFDPIIMANMVGDRDIVAPFNTGQQVYIV